PLPERHQRADHQDAAGAVIEMRPGPDVRPRVPCDEVDEFRIEGILTGDRFVDPGVAQHLSALCHAGIAALFVVHWYALLSGVSDFVIPGRSPLRERTRNPATRSDCWIPGSRLGPRFARSVGAPRNDRWGLT